MNPMLGWYANGFGCREPATTLLGTGDLHPDAGALVTALEFRP
jgi:hypothetical protein